MKHFNQNLVIIFEKVEADTINRVRFAETKGIGGGCILESGFGFTVGEDGFLNIEIDARMFDGEGKIEW